jgi:hypothetical protein
MGQKLKRVPVNILPGTHPTADSTLMSSVRCIDTNKVYFKRVDGQTYIRPIPSWSILAGVSDVVQAAVFLQQLFDPVGVPRTQSWHNIAGTDWLITGTTRKLYASRTNGQTYDITPLRTSSDSIANAIATTNGSSIITVTKAGHGLYPGDHVQISGAATFNGVADTSMNKKHAVLATPTTDTFTVDTSDLASATGSGSGAGTILYRQVLYSETRVWSFDNFGSILAICPGEDGTIYEWDGTTTALPTAVTNAPTANWIFVSNNAIVALGAASTKNRIHACAIGDRTNWTEGPGSTAWKDDAEGIGQFVTQARSRDTNLLYTNHEVLVFRYVGLPDLWDWDYLMTSDGINSAVARTAIDDVIYWQGWTGVPYWFDGSSAALIPNNTCIENMRASGAQDLTAFVRPMPEFRQVWFYNQAFSVGTPTTASYAIFDYDEEHWTAGTHNATAAENPAKRIAESPVFGYGDSPTSSTTRFYVADGNGDYSLNESGGVAMSLTTSYMSLDQNTCAEILEFLADVANNSGTSFSVSITAVNNPVNEGAGTGADAMTTSTYTFDPDGTDGILLTDATGKYWSLTIEKAAGTATDWVLGKMMLGVQEGVPL